MAWICYLHICWYSKLDRMCLLNIAGFSRIMRSCPIFFMDEWGNQKVTNLFAYVICKKQAKVVKKLHGCLCECIKKSLLIKIVLRSCSMIFS